MYDHNPYDWVKCEVTLPKMQLVTESASPWARGFATGAFGLMGLALTSGVNQHYEHVSFKSYFKIAEKGIVILQGCDDGSDLRIPWNDIAGVSTYESFWSPLTLVINLKDGRDGYIFFDNWSTTNTHIHLIRGISRIILSK